MRVADHFRDCQSTFLTGVTQMFDSQDRLSGEASIFAHLLQILIIGVMLVGPGLPSSAVVLGDESEAKPSDVQEPQSLVYFIGSVERKIAERSIVDLGEVHSLRTGSVVVVFRSRNNQFIPMGTMKVAESFPTWMVTERSADFTTEVGDFVMFIKTVGELGTSHAMRDRFLADQYIGSRDRNGYSTVRMDSAARTLNVLQKQQPRWVQKQGIVAGEIYGQTLGTRPPGSMDRLLQQINVFRELESMGFPVAEAAGVQWKTVMMQLQLDKLNSNKPTDSSISDDDDAASGVQTSIEDIQAMVETRLFDRNREEQAIASAMIVCLMRSTEKNEPAWLKRRLLQTQFPLLAGDDQFLDDIGLALRQLREREQDQSF